MTIPDTNVLGDDTLLTAQQAADALTVSVRTLERWRLDNCEGPRAVKISDRRVAYRIGDVRTYIRQRAGISESS